MRIHLTGVERTSLGIELLTFVKHENERSDYMSLISKPYIHEIEPDNKGVERIFTSYS